MDKKLAPAHTTRQSETSESRSDTILTWIRDTSAMCVAHIDAQVDIKTRKPASIDYGRDQNGQ